MPTTKSKTKKGTSKTKKVSTSKTNATKKRKVSKTSAKDLRTFKALKLDEKLPKRDGLFSYSCIWRIYLLEDPKTKKQYKKKYWIVIGDGHKKYRKFETQYEAIIYFRNLKKYAKMRVQSANSKQIVRYVYTFYEMLWSGVDIEQIKLLATTHQTKTFNENEDYHDELSKYENFTDEDLNDAFNEEEINKVLLETENSPVIIIEEEDKNKKETLDNKFTSTFEIIDNTNEYNFDEKLAQTSIFANPENENNQNYYNKPIVETIETKIVEEKDPYEITEEISFKQEETFEKESINSNENENFSSNDSNYDVTEEIVFLDEKLPTPDETITESRSLYELAIEDEPEPTQIIDDNVSKNEEIDNLLQTIQEKNNDEEDIELTQYNTSLNNLSSASINSVLPDGKYRSKSKIMFWLLITLICLVLAGIVVIALLWTSNIIK